ncbi:cardiolipin synthetase [Clostridium perfringens C str. JGS1495]|nr:cardiolipin synthetase [Clostridium perfringens C str. JGS1495]
MFIISVSNLETVNNNIIKEVIIMAQVKQGRGYVYCIQYHIVWCVKYRRKCKVTVLETS